MTDSVSLDDNTDDHTDGNMVKVAESHHAETEARRAAMLQDVFGKMASSSEASLVAPLTCMRSLKQADHWR